VIAKIAHLHAVVSAIDGSLCRCIAEPAAPFHEQAFLVLGQVMADIEHDCRL